MYPSLIFAIFYLKGTLTVTECVLSVNLPVNENLVINKNRLMPKNSEKKKMKRISIVTGVHGDELEGQYVCYELARRIKGDMKHLTGIVDIYPALNPLGIGSITRGIPGFDLDMNRIFPGNNEGSMTEYIASKLISDLEKSDLCIDIHASNIFLTELPQVRINENTKDKLVPLARKLNVDYIWVHSAATVLESTLAYSLNQLGTPTLVVEMGVGMRITKAYGDQLVDGIFVLMKELGIWDGDVITPKKPIESLDDEGRVHFINAAYSGVFIPCVGHNVMLQKGEHIGDIVDSLTGEISEEINSPCDGLLFTLRDFPIVDEGSLIARILEIREG